MKISKGNLSKLIDRLKSAGCRIAAPAESQDATFDLDFVETLPAELPAGPAAHPIKRFLFPPTEAILHYDISGRTVAMQEPKKDTAPQVIVGCRPCDAASLGLLDAVFGWDDRDEFYFRRREATTIITIACDKMLDTCFCTAVGLAPNSAEGSDILLEPTDGGYLAQAITEKGQALAEKHRDLFTNAEAESAPVPNEQEPLDLAAIRQWLDEHFDDAFWQEIAQTCLGCGVCTYSCPMCHCFDIVDEPSGERGTRRKNWDSCQFGHFTQHTSGHNPRPDCAARWRQRMMHKFSYLPERFGRIGCTGCGRCLQRCPMQISILDHLQTIGRKAGGGK